LNVELLYFESCPNARIVDVRLTALESELRFRLSRREVTTPGSRTPWFPEVRQPSSWTGRPFVGGQEPIGLSCRIYETPAGPAGCPTDQQLREAVSR